MTLAYAARAVGVEPAPGRARTAEAAGLGMRAVGDKRRPASRAGHWGVLLRRPNLSLSRVQGGNA